MKALLNEVHGAGSDRMLVTDLNHIGAFVARIVADPRTLNKYVIIWEDETTQANAYELGVRYSGDGEALRAKRIHVSFRRRWSYGFVVRIGTDMPCAT